VCSMPSPRSTAEPVAARRPLAVRPAPGLANKLRRLLWGTACLLLYRPTPRPAHAWRRFVLRCFGARIGKGAKPYRGVTIWAPWNLIMGEGSVMGDGVDCYSVDRIELGPGAIVSQRAYLCAAGHDYNDPAFPLVTAPIHVAAGAWVAAEAFVGPGVTVGEGGVVMARAVVLRDVEPWTVVAGNPARFLKPRRHPPATPPAGAPGGSG
jgi:putative colanic acid biosynthesis acetyltransferase WcaF